jgi:putative nucleotidyltransferase with HDIG domain
MTEAQVMSTDEILNAVGTLPILPKAVVEIIHTIENESTSANMLARQIEHDLGLLTSVLRLVNSSRYAVRGGVSSAQQAVVLLGFNTIRNLVCMVGIADYFHKNGAHRFNYEHFLRHSAGVGCVAKVLAKPAAVNPDTAFVAGMLHDIGQLALAATAPNEFGMAEDYREKHDCHIAEAERAVMGMDHAKIGAHLANSWHLPSEICDAIEFHHQILDSDSPSRMADLIHVAEVLSHALDLGSAGQRVTPLSESAMLRLGLSLHQVEQAFSKIEDEYSDFAKMLGV